jgi:hypothetical protein
VTTVALLLLFIAGFVVTACMPQRRVDQEEYERHFED